jgi:hypothetical protein
LPRDGLHFDERLDAAIERKSGAIRHLFKRSVEVTDDMRASTLRLVEVDALALSWQDRDGHVHRTELRQMHDSLMSLEGAVERAMNPW